MKLDREDYVIIMTETIIVIIVIIIAILFVIGLSSSKETYQVDNKYVYITTKEDGTQYVTIESYGFLVDPYD